MQDLVRYDVGGGGAGGDVTEGVIPMVIQAPTASLNVFAKDIFGKRERKKG